MAISTGQTASNQTNGATTLTLTFASSFTAGNFVVVAVSTLGTLPNIASDSTVTWTTAQTFASGANSVWNTVFIGRVFSGAGNTVTVTLTTSTAYSIVGVECTPAGRVDKMSVSATGSSTSPATSATPTTATASELVLFSLASRGQQTYSSPTNSSSILVQATSTLATNNDRAIALLSRSVSSTGTYSAGATQSTSNNWVAIAVTFEELPSGGGSGGISRGRML